MIGKEKCKALKEIRKQIAENNDIKYVVEECQHKGECKGTCPKCEAEVRYLERELEKRRNLGKKVVIAGVSLSVAASFAACTPVSVVNSVYDSISDVVSPQELGGVAEPDYPDPGGLDYIEPVEELDGEVEYIGDEEISIEAFLDGRIPAYSTDEDGSLVEKWITDFEFKDDDWNYYQMGEMKDVDNDGALEQIINGPMGGFYLKETSDNVLILRPGTLTFGEMEYVDREDGCWIKYQDTAHVGRNYYELVKMYDTEIEYDISFCSYDEYEEDGVTVKNTVYQIDDCEVTQEEFESMRLDFLGF